MALGSTRPISKTRRVTRVKAISAHATRSTGEREEFAPATTSRIGLGIGRRRRDERLSLCVCPLRFSARTGLVADGGGTCRAAARAHSGRSAFFGGALKPAPRPRRGSLYTRSLSAHQEHRVAATPLLITKTRRPPTSCPVPCVSAPGFFRLNVMHRLREPAWRNPLRSDRLTKSETVQTERTWESILVARVLDPVTGAGAVICSNVIGIEHFARFQ
jgi:hypothetical protein